MDVGAVEQDLAQFDRDGYFVMRGAVVPSELERLREETFAQVAAGADREPRGDFLTKPLADGTVTFFRIQHLMDKALRNDALLLVAAHPGLIARVRGILGDDFMPYGSAMVFKGVEGGPIIEFHRDVGPNRDGFSANHRFFNADIYLDEATSSSGALNVVPGSHRSDVTVTSFDDDRVVEVPMAPGDVLFHDARLLHGSRETPPGAPLRRVLYYSYQSADAMATEGVLPGYPVPRTWIAEYMKLMAHAIYARRASPFHEDEALKPYDVPEEWRADVAAAELELRPIAGDLPWERVSV